MRLVGDAAARVVPDAARREPGTEARRKVARLAVVAGDNYRGGAAVTVEERRDEIRAQRERDEGAAAFGMQTTGLRIVVRMLEQSGEHRSP
jgi:hypothetical protein